MTDPSMTGDRHRAASNRFRWLSLALGGVLVMAAFLKVLQHRTTPLAGQGLLSNPWMAFAGVEIELAVGVWLLSGLHPRASRLTTMALFSVFAIVSLRQALAQEVSCGCFGDIPVRPWWTFLFDMLAVVCLSLTSPSPAPTVQSAPRRFQAAIGAGLVLGTAAGGVMLSQPPCPIAPSADPIDLGEVPAGGVTSAALQLENRTNVLVRLAAVRTSCECLTLSRSRDEVGPSETVTATLTLDMRDKPNFRGRLRVEVIGEDAEGRIAFTLVVLVHVTPVRTAFAAGSGTPKAPCRS